MKNINLWLSTILLLISLLYIVQFISDPMWFANTEQYPNRETMHAVCFTFYLCTSIIFYMAYFVEYWKEKYYRQRREMIDIMSSRPHEIVRRDMFSSLFEN